MGFREWFLAPVLTELKKLVIAVADVSADLNLVAEGLIRVRGSLTTLLAENTALRARNSELEAEDVAESSAAANVRSEFNALSDLFPTVDPVAPEDVQAEVPSADTEVVEAQSGE